MSQLVSSRQLTTFSDYRYKPESPDFLSTEQYCTYLEGYCKNFNLNPHITLSTSVTKIERSQSGGHTIHLISSGKKSEWHCDAVALCSGLHVTPNIPMIPGLEKVPVVIHSSEFKERKQFGEGKDVLILGSGETGMDIAYLAVTSATKSVTISHRDGFLCAPKARKLSLRSRKGPIINLMGTACSRTIFLWHDPHFVSQRKCTVRCRSGESLRYCLCSSCSERFLPPMVVL